jgi:rhomboid protease GluP
MIGGFIPHARFTTTILLLVNFGLYIATAIYSMNHSRDGGFMDVDIKTRIIFGASVPLMYESWWRLITAGFLHGGLLHILMNAWSLSVVGAEVEEAYGSARLLIFYFASTVGGFALSSIRGYTSVGASAAIFGLIGAMIAFGLRDKGRHGAAIRSYYVQWLIMGLVLTIGFSGIDMYAHIGGLVAGFVAGYVAGTPRVRGERLWLGVAAVCVALTAFAFVKMYALFATVSRELAR